MNVRILHLPPTEQLRFCIIYLFWNVAKNSPREHMGVDSNADALAFRFQVNCIGQ